MPSHTWNSATGRHHWKAMARTNGSDTSARLTAGKTADKRQQPSVPRMRRSVAGVSAVQNQTRPEQIQAEKNGKRKYANVFLTGGKSSGFDVARGARNEKREQRFGEVFKFPSEE